MNNVELIVEIAKRLNSINPKMVYLLSGLIFEAEKRQRTLNRISTLEAIHFLCHDSPYIKRLGCEEVSSKALEVIMLAVLAEL